MSWFRIISNNVNLQQSTPSISYVVPPLRRNLLLEDVFENIETNEIVYCNLNSKIINRYFSSSNQPLTDDDSYLVVYQDLNNEDFFVPVKSKIINGILYFKPHERIVKSTSPSRYYAVYYGMSNIKYIKPVSYGGATVYQQASQEEIDEAENGDYYDLSTSEILNYSFAADSNSDKLYKLAFYNEGQDWVNNTSTKVGSKAFGIFDGPSIKIYGSKSNSFGKFRIRIFSYTETAAILNTPVVDWVTVDCYSFQSLENQVLYQKLNLDFNRYIFELETLSEKNVMSTSRSVNIDRYNFVPNYGFVLDKEQINSDISFVTIGGIR